MAAAEAARLRAEEEARLAAVAHRQQLAFAAGGLVLGVATAMFVRSARHHPVLDAALDAARRPIARLVKAAAQSCAGRAALVAARRASPASRTALLLSVAVSGRVVTGTKRRGPR